MRVLIVDDEAPARERLRRLLDETPEHEVAGVAAGGAEAIESVQATQIDVVLLDIRMPGMDGIEVARHLSAMLEPPAVIFVTAFDQYAIDAFDSHAVGYLLKPIRREKLQEALAAVKRLTRPQLASLAQRAEAPSRRQQIAVRVRDRLKLIRIADVLFFSADQKYVTVNHKGGSDLIEDSLKSLEDEFGEGFLRIHRNALVAVQAIDSVERGGDGSLEVIIKGTRERLTVSRRLAAEVLKSLRG